jgi:hypothetical protein
MYKKVSNLHSGCPNRTDFNNKVDLNAFEYDRGPMCLHRAHTKEPGLLLELNSIYAFSSG